jgi:hypothetical protein
MMLFLVWLGLAFVVGVAAERRMGRNEANSNAIVYCGIAGAENCYRQ